MAAPTWLTLLLVLWLASRTRLTREVRLAFSAVFALATPFAAWGIYEALTSEQARASFGNGNYFGALMLLLVPIALAEGAEATGRWRFGWRVIAGVCLAALLGARSASVLVGLGVEVVVLLVIAPGILGISGAVGRCRVRVAAVVVTLLSIVLLVAALFPSASEVPGLDTIRSEVVGPNTATRVEMWKSAIDVIRAHPLAGGGPDGFRVAVQPFMTRRLVQLEFGSGEGALALIRDPHSVPLMATASLGLLGAAVLCWLLIEWVLLLLRRIREDRGVIRSGYAVAGLGFASACLVLAWPVRWGALPLLVAGLAVSLPDSRGRTGAAVAAEREHQTPALPRMLLALVCSAIALALGTAALAGDRLLERSKVAPTYAEAVRLVALASKIQPTRPEVSYQRLYLAGLGVQQGSVVRDDFRRSVSEAGEEIAGNGAFLAGLAQVSLDDAHLTGRTDLSFERELLERARRLAPTVPVVPTERLHLAVEEGHADATEAALREVEDLGIQHPRVTLYRYYLASLSGDAAGAAVLAEEIRSEAPWLVPLMVPRGGG